MIEQKKIEQPAIKELQKGLWFWHNPKNKIAVLKIHYSADPDKDTLAWKDQTKIGMSDADWEREYEINFEQQRGSRVIPGYAETIHRKELSYNPYLTVWRGWDFGFRRPACILTQMNEQDQWLWLQEFMGQDVLFEEFVDFVIANTPQHVKIDGEKVPLRFRDFCDPAGVQRSDKDKRSSIEILQAFNIHPIYKKSNPGERARIMRSQFAVRQNGQPGAYVDLQCKIAHDGLMGGWHLPETFMAGHEDDPDKDGFYEHLFDAAGYIAYNTIKYKAADPEKRKPKRVNYIQKRYNSFTGA